jgi:hypothetical protein
MPNFDGGHYFLTVLAPIRNDKLFDHGGIKSSPVHMVRAVLATLPRAQQSPITGTLTLNSPFARNRRTHFARFAVIDDVIYNGRNTTDSLKATLLGLNPMIAQPVDELSSPYLLFAADFDATSGNPAELRSYLTELWGSMQEEMQSILRYCRGFDGVTDASKFADYIMACQIETTMPFNDYWIDAAPLPTIPSAVLYGPPGITGVATLAALLLRALGAGGWAWGAIAGVAFLGFIASLIFVYWLVMDRGRRPFPTAPDSSLASVLKALYLQQNFIRFAVETQGADNPTLHRKFGEFLALHAPSNLESPTQERGVIKSEWVKP